MSTLTEVVAALGGIKSLFKAVSAVVTLLLNRFSFKFDEDLPGPLLIVMTISGVYFLSLIQDAQHRQNALVYLFVGLMLSSVVFLLVYRFFSYQKKVDTRPPRWKFWKSRYDTVRIVGGYWLRRDAKNTIEGSNITVADYFSGVAFDEDKVWWRWSRALSWLTLVIAYFSLTFCAVGSLFLIVESWL